MKRKFTFFVLTILLGFPLFLNAQFTSRTGICYEETLTIGDFYDISNKNGGSCYGLTIDVLNGTGAIVDNFSIGTGITNSSLVNLLGNIALYKNKQYGTDTTITLKFTLTTTPGNTEILGTGNYTFAKGYNDIFALPVEGISILNASNEPRSDLINLFDYIEGSSSSKSGIFTSSTATISNNTGWDINDLSDAMNLWKESHTITLYPTKVKGCGTENVSQTVKLKVDFDFDANIKLCRTGEKVDLMEFVNKPLPVTYTSVKYTGEFECGEVDSAISGTIFDPTKVPSTVSSVTISYIFVQKSVNNVEKQRATGTFTISILDAPKTPVIALDKAIYCTSSTASVSISNTTSDYYLYTEKDTSYKTTPVSVLNVYEGYKVTAANINTTTGCYSKAETVIPVDNVNADFTVSNIKPSVGETVVFTASYTGAKSYNWSIDPSKTEQEINYIFNSSGTVNATLSIESKNGCSANQTKEITVIKDVVNNHMQNSEDLQVFPQPVEKEIHIQISRNTNALITITDLSGKVVLTDNILEESNILDISALNRGMYILTINVGESVSVRKFIKQ